MAVEHKGAKLVAVRDLPTIVEAAVKAAGVRTEGMESLVTRWELAGIVVKDFSEGQKFSTAIARQVSEHGIEASPAVLQIDDHILAGFFERGALPQFRNI
ncbi:hypothetical protein ACFOKI_02790 [Sphingomonas qilianensis]|uniref:Uncharacterized protein n=1 Tax=Sphingomonas qilianensis TaxID=1736690 RepID=A0ABU9XVJ8_9SPHN